MNRRALVLGGAMVLLVNFITVALRAYTEAAFLHSYAKSQLPWLFVASAAGFAIAAFGYDRVTRFAHTTIVDLALLVALVAVAAATPSLLDAGASPAAIVVGVSALSQVAGLALWNRVAQAVAGRDARRMLPLVGAAVTTGGMIAGLGAGGLGIHGAVLAYLAAGAAVVVMGLTIAQARTLATGGAPGATLPAGASAELGSLQLRLLRALVICAVLEGVVTTVIDFQFLAEVKSQYRDATLVLLLFYGGTNAVLLLLQVTAVPRMLVTRSLPTSFGIHPTVVVLAYVAFAMVPGLFAIAGTRTADQVLRLATSRTSQELSMSALPPIARARWKVLLRGALWPVGAAGAALALLELGSAGLAHPVRLAGVMIAIAIPWWVFARLAGRRFQAALAAPLDIQTRRRADEATIDLETLERWTEVAGDDDRRTRALARAALAHTRVDASDLAEHLRHDEPAVRAALFEQLARTPSPALVRELRAAVQIEDDDRALVLGLEALAVAGDDGGLERGRSRAALSREVAEAVRTAEYTLHGGDGLEDELATLCGRDPHWAVALVRARGAALDDDALASLLATAIADPERRAGALVVIAHVGPPAAIDALDAALATASPEAIAAVASLDERGSTDLAARASQLSPLGRLVLARALAATPVATAAIGTLLEDPDPEVAHAALRTALAIARGGGALPPGPIAAAHRSALAALTAALDARDAAHAASAAPSDGVDGASPWSACARHELELATRNAVARLIWVAAVEVAAAGRDPAALAAVARRLIGGREPDRRRALDVTQELHAGRTEILAVIERWLQPAAPVRGTDTVAALAAHDPWLAGLCRGELADIEPTLVALRRAALFSAISGPALAALAPLATARTVDGELFAAGAAASSMFVIERGVAIAHRAGAASRRLERGAVIGELAMLTGAPRAATVISEGPIDVLEIDRDVFVAAARRAPELVLGLSSSLAGWLAPNRPDVLG